MLAEARELFGVFGKSRQALEMVDRVLAIKTDNVDALNLKADILFDLDRDDEAREFHLQAFAQDPNSVEALHGLASIANERGNFTDALEWIRCAFSAIPNDADREFMENEDFRQRLIAELYNEQAFALWYLGEVEEATRVLSQDAPDACPLEIESFEDQLDWLQHHRDRPEE
jgi:tetratricopeptide (TPR) repeat protein